MNEEAQGSDSEDLEVESLKFENTNRQQ